MPRKGTENTPHNLNSDSADFTFVHWRPNEQGRNNSNRGSQTSMNGGSSAQDGCEHCDSRGSGGPSGNVVSGVGSSLSTHSHPSIPTTSLLASAAASAASSGGQRDSGISFAFSTSLSSGKSKAKQETASSSGKASTSSSRSKKRRRADDDEDVVVESGIAGTSEPVQNNAPIRGRPRTTNPSAKRRRVKQAAVSSQPGAEAEAMIQMASSSSVAPPTRRGTRSGPRAENPYPVIPPSLLPPPSQPEVVDGGSSPSTTQVESASNTHPRRAENPYPDPLTFLPPTGSRSVDSGSSVLGRPFSSSATSGAVIPTAVVGAVPGAISVPYPSPQLANVPVDTTSMATTSSPNPDPFVPVDLSRLPLENFPIFAPMALTPNLDVAHPLPHELKVQHQRPRFERPQLPSATPQPNPDLQQSSLPFASGHQNATQNPATNVVGHASPVPGTPPLYATYPPDDGLATLFAALNDWFNKLPLPTTQSLLSGNDPTPAQEDAGNHSTTINSSQLPLPTVSQENSRPMTNATVARQGTRSQVPPPVVSNPRDSEDSFRVAYHEHHTRDNLPK